MSKGIDQVAAQAGIAADYINAHGQRQAISPETKRKLLAAMNPASLQPSTAPLPLVKVFYHGNPVALPLGGDGEFQWVLLREDGSQQEGRASAHKTLTLPGKLPLGYHQLTLSQGEQQWACRLIVAPKRCYEPDALLTGKKLWGACVQLYTLRSERNWGIGDFGDLRAMVGEVGERGGAFIGLNPIHALYPASPESASPYSPSSRRWLNVVYIDVNVVEDFQLSQAAQKWWQKATTQKLLAKARSSELVDYSTVTQLKLAALNLAFPHFQARKPQDALKQEFERFVGEGAAVCISRQRSTRYMPISVPKTALCGDGQPGRRSISRAIARQWKPSVSSMRMRLPSTCGCNGWRPASLPSASAKASSARCQLGCTAIWRSVWQRAGRKPGVNVSCIACKPRWVLRRIFSGRWGKTGACRRWIRM